MVVAGSLALAGACDDGAGGPAGPLVIRQLGHDNPPFLQANEQAFAAYTAIHPDVTITPTVVKYQSLGASLVSDLKQDRLEADLVMMIPSWVCSFADNLADVPSDVLSLTEAQRLFFPAPLAGATCDGHLKGLPMEYNLEYGGVVVNVDKYQEKYPGKTPTWADWSSFITEAAALSEFDADGKPRANGLDIDPFWPQPAKHIFLSQILQRGGSYWSARGDFDFQTPAARASLTEMVSWLTERRVMFRDLVPERNTFVTTRLVQGASDYGWNDPQRPLSVMGYAGTWAVPNTVSQLPAGVHRRYEFYTVPPMVGTEHRFVQNSGWALVVPKTARNQKAAWDIARSMAVSAEGARRWAAISGTLPALRANGTVEATAGDPTLAKVQPLLERGQWVGYIPAAAIETVEGAIVSAFFDAVTGKKSVDQALLDMQTTANEALKQNR